MCAQLLILALLAFIYVKANTIGDTRDALYCIKENTEMVLHTSRFARSDIQCAMICMTEKTCCRTSYEANTKTCYIEMSNTCKRRIQSTDDGGRITIEKGRFPSCTLPTDVPKTKNVSSCKLPADVPKTSNEVDGLDNFGNVKFGGFIKYECKANHIPTSGDLVRKCQLDQSWSGKIPVCEESCEMPEVMGTTQSNYGTVVSGQISVGGHIEYTCKDGYYYIAGDLMRKCNIGGKWSGTTLTCKEDCKRSKPGYGYDGRRNSTITNKTCQRWDTDFPHSQTHYTQKLDYNLAENYCRNPDKVPDIWCYTTDPHTRWEHCEVPYCTQPAKECKETPEGVDYFGTVNTTRAGIPCQKWSETTPHSHKFTSLARQENYCRNPYQLQSSPWCYTTNAAVEWDYCNIPDC